jgi:magnesium transporter
MVARLRDEDSESTQTGGGRPIHTSLDEPYLKINFLTMIRKRAGWLCALFLLEFGWLTDDALRA